MRKSPVILFEGRLDVREPAVVFKMDDEILKAYSDTVRAMARSIEEYHHITAQVPAWNPGRLSLLYRFQLAKNPL